MNPSYDNSFGSFSSGGTTSGMAGNPFNQAPTSSGSGDIVLTSTTSKKSKKWLIVVGIVILSLAIVIAGSLFLTNRNLSSDNELREKFNQLANYIVSGEASSSDFDMTYDDNFEYYLFTDGLSDEEKKTIYDNTRQLTDEFAKYYASVENKNNLIQYIDLANSKVSDMSDLIDFISTVYVKKPIGVQEIVSWYQANGENNALSQIDDYFNSTGMEENVYYINYRDLLEQWAKYLIEKIKLYSSNGCGISPVFDDACMNSKGAEIATTLSDINQNISNARLDLMSLYDASEKYIYDVFVMRDLIYGSDVTDLVTIGDGENNENEIVEEDGEKNVK